MKKYIVLCLYSYFHLLQLQGITLLSVDEIIQSIASDPIDKSIPLVSMALRKNDIYIPKPSGESRKSTQFLTGLDNEGNVWLYVYSDEKHISKAFPEGTEVGIVNFEGLADIIFSNEIFRGIYLNSAYPIPREMFKLFFQQ